MKELATLKPEQISEGQRNGLVLLVCDESSITCANFRELQQEISDYGADAVLVMPDYQYREGRRGFVKANILASVSERIKGVMPLGYEASTQELDKNWAMVKVQGKVTWDEYETILPDMTTRSEVSIEESTSLFDREMMTRAKRTVESSNCWLDPAGCVFVRDGEVLVESTSTTFNNSHCERIPVAFRDFKLDPGERMLFCDSLHAESVGIAKAAKEGISLSGSTIYITKFPCRPCARELIGAEIRNVVFEEGSYGLKDASLLVENGVQLKRVSSD